jgi:hypothetical protein
VSGGGRRVAAAGLLLLLLLHGTRAASLALGWWPLGALGGWHWALPVCHRQACRMPCAAAQRDCSWRGIQSCTRLLTESISLLDASSRATASRLCPGASCATSAGVSRTIVTCHNIPAANCNACMQLGCLDQARQGH